MNDKFVVFYSLKTGLLKWRPDYEIGSDEYQQAGEQSKMNSKYKKMNIIQFKTHRFFIFRHPPVPF